MARLRVAALPLSHSRSTAIRLLGPIRTSTTYAGAYYVGRTQRIWLNMATTWRALSLYPMQTIDITIYKVRGYIYSLSSLYNEL